MNSQVLEGRLNQLLGRAQKRWGRLTHDDLDEIEGQKTTLEGKLRERYGYTKNEASEQIDNFMRDAKEQLGEMQDELGSRIRDKSEGVQHTMQKARKQMRDRAEAYESKLKDVEARDVAQTVKSNPLLLVGAVLLLSVFVGLWLKSMNR
jgi:uncharacterized protein YjbJ (UPF0337 family)